MPLAVRPPPPNTGWSPWSEPWVSSRQYVLRTSSRFDSGTYSHICSGSLIWASQSKTGNDFFSPSGPLTVSASVTATASSPVRKRVNTIYTTRRTKLRRYSGSLRDQAHLLGKGHRVDER